MKTQYLCFGALVFATLMLLIAALACDLPGAGLPVAPSDAVTPFCPGGDAKVPTTEPAVLATAAVETPSGSGGGSGPNLVIAAVGFSGLSP